MSARSRLAPQSALRPQSHRIASRRIAQIVGVDTANRVSGILPPMPVDVSADVIANTPLSADYNVLALARARDRRRRRARTVRDGEGRAADTIRCCAVRFRCSKSCATTRGAPTGISLLSKRIGAVDVAALRRAAGRARRVPRSARPAVHLVEPPAEAWMVAGGVGLAPFATLAEALRARGVAHDAVLRRAPRRRALLSRFVPRARRRARADHRRRQRRRARPHRRAARSRGSPTRPADAPVMIYACGPEGHARGDGEDGGDARPAVPGVGRADHGLRPGRLLQLRRADARRRRRVSSRAIVHRRAGARRRDQNSVGLSRRRSAIDMDLSVQHRLAAR